MSAPRQNSQFITTVKFVASAFQDGQGNTSMMRIVTFLVACGIVIPHTYLSCHLGTIFHYEQSELWLLGVMLGAKLWQNGQEFNAEESK